MCFMVGIPRKILDGKTEVKGMVWTREAHGTEVRRGFRGKSDAKNSRARLRSIFEMILKRIL
jgi:hypothetical protein